MKTFKQIDLDYINVFTVVHCYKLGALIIARENM